MRPRALADIFQTISSNIYIHVVLLHIPLHSSLVPSLNQLMNTFETYPLDPGHLDTEWRSLNSQLLGDLALVRVVCCALFSIASGIWLTASHLGEDAIAGYAGITVVLPLLTTTHAWFMARDLREFSLRSDASRNWCEATRATRDGPSPMHTATIVVAPMAGMYWSVVFSLPLMVVAIVKLPINLCDWQGYSDHITYGGYRVFQLLPLCVPEGYSDSKTLPGVPLYPRITISTILVIWLFHLCFNLHYFRKLGVPQPRETADMPFRHVYGGASPCSIRMVECNLPSHALHSPTSTSLAGMTRRTPYTAYPPIVNTSPGLQTGLNYNIRTITSPGRAYNRFSENDLTVMG